jgi:hypothetical protein
MCQIGYRLPNNVVKSAAQPCPRDHGRREVDEERGGVLGAVQH